MRAFGHFESSEDVRLDLSAWWQHSLQVQAYAPVINKSLESREISRNTDLFRSFLWDFEGKNLVLFSIYEILKHKL